MEEAEILPQATCLPSPSVFLQTASREYVTQSLHKGADKPLARAGMKEATATEDFCVHISYL
jgi:hypothetical protein